MADLDHVEVDGGLGTESASNNPTNKTDTDRGKAIDYNTPNSLAIYLDDGIWRLTPPYDVKVKTKIGDILDEDGDVMANYYITQGDLLPPFEGQLVDENGPVNLSGRTAKLIMSKDSVTKVDGDCDILSQSQGRVSYTWAEGDTDTPGTFIAVVEVTDSSSPFSFPSYRHLQIHIQEKPRYPVPEEP